MWVRNVTLMAASALTSQFAAHIAPEMKARRYRKTGATWHRELNQMIQVFNIQKSYWGYQFYLNVGIYLRDLGTESRPTVMRLMATSASPTTRYRCPKPRMAD
jgi:hypothetical protein